MAAPFGKSDAVTFLAPMQDITDADFMDIVARRGSADFYMAEYFRIHEYFELEPSVLKAVLSRPAGRSVSAQFIGEDEEYIRKAIEQLQKYPQIKSLDLNLGCPAPKIYRKNVGGGLLRDTKKIRSVMKVMRENWGGVFSVKMRLGFDTSANFEEIFSTVLEGQPDFVTIHARTVRQLYRGECDYSKIATAVKMSPVPVIANGDIFCASKALEVMASTKCAGVMVGRHAVRNPWIFRQISEAVRGEKIFMPTLSDVRIYVDDLLKSVLSHNVRYSDSRLKKFLNFVGVCVEPTGDFLKQMRRSKGIAELLKVCDNYLIDNGNADKIFPDVAYEGLCSRPNHEDR